MTSKHTPLQYVACVRSGNREIFYSLPSTDRQAAISACFTAFPEAREVSSCRWFNRFVTGGDMRWHSRYYWERERA